MNLLQSISGVPTAVSVVERNLQIIDAFMLEMIQGQIWAECPARGTKYRLILVLVDPTDTADKPDVTIDWEGPYDLAGNLL